MLKNLLLFLFATLLALTSISQNCNPLGNPVVYGTNDTWIGYVYDNNNLTGYKGYVLEGSPGNPGFYQEYGGQNVDYPTNGCPVNTESFSVRYRLTKTFLSGDYDFTVAGDDGYRLSLDGGATWLIDNWVYNGYNQNTVTVTLNGTYDMVLEYFEYAHHNRLSFAVNVACTGSENTDDYGVANVWKGYIYNGTSFNYYKGTKDEGTPASSNFDENFGGSYARFNTSSCSLLAEHFSSRYRLRKTFANGNYVFLLGGDKGYRLSIDGGSTWVIDNWANTSFTTSNYVAILDGTYDLVLEYYQGSGTNRASFSSGIASTLPVELVSFSAKETNAGIQLDWVTGGDEAKNFNIERSNNGTQFSAAGNVAGQMGRRLYTFTDPLPLTGKLFYRLKMTDIGGHAVYSKTIMLRKEGDNVQIFPTFVNDAWINISTQKATPEASLVITDISGRRLNHVRLGDLRTGQTMQLHKSRLNLLKGVYILQLYSRREVISTERVIVQ